MKFKKKKRKKWLFPIWKVGGQMHWARGVATLLDRSIISFITISAIKGEPETYLPFLLHKHIAIEGHIFSFNWLWPLIFRHLNPYRHLKNALHCSTWGPRFILRSTCPSIMETCKIKQERMTRKCDREFFIHYFRFFFPLVGSAFMTYEYKFVKILIKTAWKLEITGFLVECHVFQLIFFPNKSAKFHSSSKRLQL